MGEMLESEDPYTGGEHTWGVVSLVLRVGDELGLDAFGGPGVLVTDSGAGVARSIGLKTGDIVRAINGELRLWVNGEEVSGGNNCEPRSGYLCLEQEGAPIEFRNIRVRELP